MHTSEEKILAGLSHLAIIFNFLGFIAAVAIYFWQKDKSSFTARHAKQALGYQAAVYLLSMVGGFFLAAVAAGGMMMGGPFGVFAAVPFAFLIPVAFVVYAVYAAIQAFQGKGFTYIVIGDFVDRI